MLKEPIDIIFSSVPCAGFANPNRVNPAQSAPRMRELTSAEIDKVCSVPPAPLFFAEFAPVRTPSEQALANMMSLR